jgi:hypothetical protein
MSGKRIWIFNLMLGGLLVWGVSRLQDGWVSFDRIHGAGRIQGQLAAGETSRVAQAAPGAVSAAVSAEGWEDIAARNPFSVDRNDLDVVEVSRPPVTNPKPVLFGTLLLGDQRLALLGKAGAGNRDRQPVKVGEDFDGWRIVEIADKSAVVAANGVQESLIVGKVQIDRRSERTASPAMVSAPAAPQSTMPAPAASPRAASPDAGKPPAEPPPGTRVVPNPFGHRIERVP